MGRISVLVLLPVLFPAVARAQQSGVIDVQQVKDTELEYRTATFGSLQRVQLSDLKVWPQIITGQDPFRVYFPESTDLKLELLRRGWATLKAPQAASEAYRLAESQARQGRVGIWASASAAQSPEATAKMDWGAIASVVGQVFVWVLSAGIVALFSRFVYTRWYIQRRVNLILLGEPSAGKSAILERLLNPKVTRQQILQLTMTPTLQRRRHQHFIPKGRFEIHPTLSDIPGAAFGTAWDALMGSLWQRRPSALLLVLAPTTAAHVIGNGEFDEKYVYTQLGYVQAYIAGGLGSGLTRKPRLVVLFVNKFDLSSAAPPGDTSAATAVQRVQQLFREHIQVAQTAARGASVPFKLIIGSALENWNCEMVIDVVTQELYGF